MLCHHLLSCRCLTHTHRPPFAAQNTSFLEQQGRVIWKPLSLLRCDRGADRQVGRLNRSRNVVRSFGWPVTPTWGLAHFHCRTATSGSCCQPFPAIASRSTCPSCPTLGHPQPKPLTTLSLTAVPLTPVKALRTENGRVKVCARDLGRSRSFRSQAWWLKM